MKINTVAKYIDQPLLINKLNKHMPKVLVGAGSLIAIGDAVKHKDEKNKLLKNTIISASIIGGTLLATKKFKLLDIQPQKEIVKKQVLAVREYIKKTNLKDEKYSRNSPNRIMGKSQ